MAIIHEPSPAVGFTAGSPEQQKRHERPFLKRNRGAFQNYLRAKYEMYTGKVTVTSTPYILIVDPCDACQLRCPTCPTGIENEHRRIGTTPKVRFRKRRSVMPQDLLDAILDELGDNLFLILFFNAGEPLLNRKLPAFIRKAKSRNIETEIHTHLSLPLTDVEVEDLMSSGLDNLNVSIDGFSQQAYQTHRVGGDLDLVKKNLERLVEVRDRSGIDTYITYNFLVFSFNEHEIPAAKRYCRQLGINFNARDAFMDDPAWLPSHRKGEEPWAVPREVRLIEDQTVGWSPPLPIAESSRWPAGCGWHYGYTVVQPGGQLAPCDAVSKEVHDMGTIVPGENTFEQVWNGDSYRRARAHFAGNETAALDHVKPLCIQCPWPQLMRQLFSLNDAKVILNFYEMSDGTDPMLEKAFGLFCRLRYGVAMDELFQCGEIYPQQELFVGHENPTDTAEFVRFVEENLLHERG